MTEEKKRPNVYAHFHNYWLEPEEEKRFNKALVERYGTQRGYVRIGTREAVLEWIRRILGE